MEVYTIEEYYGHDEGNNLVHVTSCPELAEQWIKHRINHPTKDQDYKQSRTDFIIVTWQL